MFDRALRFSVLGTDQAATPGTDLARAVEQLRDRRVRLQDAVATRTGVESRACSLSPHSTAGDQAVREVLDAAAWAEQKLAAALGRVAICQTMVAQLAAVAQQLTAMESQDELVASIPALALGVYPRAAVALLKVRGDGAVQVFARAGAAFDALQARLDEEARALVLGRGPRATSGGSEPMAAAARRVGRAVVIPLSCAPDAWVLAVEREEGDASAVEDFDQVALFGSLVGGALESARAADAAREAAARDAAMLAAIREGLLAVDRNGVVRSANPAALAALGLRRDDVVGRRLRDVDGLGALATAIASGTPDAGIVSVPRGEVSVRLHPYDRGVVATVREVGTEHAAPRRSPSAPSARYTFANLVGVAPAFLRVLEDAKRAAASDMPILICGESGTGKELLAQAIHNASPRATEPFVGINVTAIPRELPESELFGYEGGAFTGAKTGGHVGKFELAGKGTLLLDEIGDMPAEMQAKLLRVLQERLVQRVGSARDIPVRARIIATSHRDLPEAVSMGRFRLDLFHRLCVIHLHLPPLRERRSDVPLIVEHQLRLHEERTGRKVRIAPQGMELLQSYDWPGNVRELVNLLEGEIGVLPAGEDLFTRPPETLLQARAAAGTSSSPSEIVSLAELERRACEETLAKFRGNVARAAMALGVAKGTLYAKIKRYALDTPKAASPEPAPRASGRSWRGS